MNSDNSSLQRLFRAAARVRQQPPEELPFDLEVRLLAAWRSGLVAENPVLPMPLIRGALVCACAILLASVGVTFLTTGHDSPAGDLIIVDSLLQLTLMQ
jgi:hypothetical protein